MHVAYSEIVITNNYKYIGVASIPSSKSRDDAQLKARLAMAIKPRYDIGENF